MARRSCGRSSCSSYSTVIGLRPRRVQEPQGCARGISSRVSTKEHRLASAQQSKLGPEKRRGESAQQMRQMKSQSADLQRMRDEQHQKELDALRAKVGKLEEAAAAAAAVKPVEALPLLLLCPNPVSAVEESKGAVPAWGRPRP